MAGWLECSPLVLKVLVQGILRAEFFKNSLCLPRSQWVSESLQTALDTLLQIHVSSLRAASPTRPIAKGQPYIYVGTDVHV